MLIVVAAMGLRALMPAGYMASTSTGHMSIELCSGVAGQSVVIALPGTQHSDDGDHGKGRTDSPCAFSGLTAAALSAADPIVLSIAIAFIMAIGLRAIGIVPTAPSPFLRPPLRGPPALF
jgi:hypothetical protein